MSNEEKIVNTTLIEIKEILLELTNNRVLTTKNKQKIYAIASYIEFIRNGAEIKVGPIENNKIVYELNMK